jgi:hypothetical protein
VFPFHEKLGVEWWVPFPIFPMEYHSPTHDLSWWVWYPRVHQSCREVDLQIPRCCWLHPNVCCLNVASVVNQW